MNSLSAEERANGSDNYYSSLSEFDRLNRRDFIRNTLAIGGATAVGAGAMYFGYQKPINPVRVCVIGTGDEGNVLIGAINPDYVQVTAICDMRPSSIHRAFHGDWSSENAKRVRKGLMDVYGWDTEEEARKHVREYSDWKEAVQDPNIDGVIIATPLFLHAPIAIAAMQNGKHVLCEKLMAHNVAECKLMTRQARMKGEERFLSIGHQRHYSILYDNAVNLIKWGLLGEIHSIRAQWHRNNAPGRDSWSLPIPGGETTVAGKEIDRIANDLKKLTAAFNDPATSASERKKLGKKVAQWMKLDADQSIDAKKYGYVDNKEVYRDRTRTAMEELIRWRLWDRTGGGLMAELGSHQLDAASIFIAALSQEKGKHVHPLTVHAVGGRHTAPMDRDAADHVYCTFEYPGQGYDYDFDVGYYDQVNNYGYKFDPRSGKHIGGEIPGYEQDNNKKVVVTYSSINGNGFGGYGEVVMGTKGTMILDKEKEVLVYPSAGTSYKTRAKKQKGGAVVLDTTQSGDAAPAQAAQGAGVVSRGYKEEIEHWAWCISTGDHENQPRCNGEVALADACVALTARQAIKNSQKKGGHGFIQFQPEWFDVNEDAVPESTSIEETKKTFAMARKKLGLA
ncbi:Gfo/Idh/MocA family protein [Mariniblastus fucicola]|uniref:Glucose--fructose oxidoreductase n=1 Tax=Mariniblastus fucicola TaxID=980251 RepID=A0A5B9PDF8_9BACT|nr:Gfo/Idh/MocA family oxidoreductase [Mariniblastus fucicola]QEG23130.1 Glucose--fructose oxidoreductase precursor [Mariniblastus fucicola]